MCLRVDRMITRLDSLVDGIGVSDVVRLLESLDDEDECDEQGERLFSKTRDEADKCGEIKGNHDEQKEGDPHADPEAERQIGPSVAPGSNHKSS